MTDNTSRDAIYALMQRLGANGWTVASSGDEYAAQEGATGQRLRVTPTGNAGQWAVMRAPPKRAHVIRPYGEARVATQYPGDVLRIHPAALPGSGAEWSTRKRPTVTEMLIAAGGLQRFVARLHIAYGATDISVDVVACAP